MKRILLIEDEEQLRRNTAEILELSNYEVIVAEHGKHGIALALQNKPDLVICDIMMPVMDGYGVLAIFQRNPELATIPFIFLTAKAERADLRKGMESGADDYLTKPFGEVELLNAIESRFKRKETLQIEITTDKLFNDFLDDASQKEGLSDLIFDKKSHFFKKKKYIYVEEEDSNRVFFIKSGKIKTFRCNADGKELVTGLYGEGDFFGYQAVIENRKLEDIAVAIEDAEVIYIPSKDFLDLLYRNADVAQKFIKLLSSGILEKEKQLLGLAYNSLRKRVAEGILKYVKKFKNPDNQPFILNISREELANISGTATESLIRTLTDFREEGLIESIDNRIVIRDLSKLERLRF